MKALAAAVLFLLAQISTSALAQALDCSKALIPKTANASYGEITNVSLASNMSEGAYDQAKQQFGANAVIYGIPVGLNYGQFRKNIQNRPRRYK